MSSQLGRMLRELREQQRKSIEPLAIELGVNKNTLGGYERGERLPDAGFLAVFAKRTGADFKQLLIALLRDDERPEARETADSLDGWGEPAPTPRLTVHEGGGQPAPIDERAVAEAVRILEEIFIERDLAPTPESRGRFAMYIVRLLGEGQRFNRTKILHLVELVG